jgi:hypothetical protein
VSAVAHPSSSDPISLEDVKKVRLSLTDAFCPPGYTINDNDLTNVFQWLTTKSRGVLDQRPRDVEAVKCFTTTLGPDCYALNIDAVVEVTRKVLATTKVPAAQGVFKELLACLNQLESDVDKALQFVKGTIDMVSSFTRDANMF